MEHAFVFTKELFTDQRPGMAFKTLPQHDTASALGAVYRGDENVRIYDHALDHHFSEMIAQVLSSCKTASAMAKLSCIDLIEEK